MTVTINGTTGVTYPAGGTDNVAGSGVGTTDTQTLTNKTFTNPTINGFTGNTSVINIGSGQIYKDVSGNVGIGTSTPAYLFDVNGASRFSGSLNWVGTANVVQANVTGNYSANTWYSVFSSGTGSGSVTTSGTGTGAYTVPGFYIIYVYGATFNAGGDSYYPYFASVPFYWSGNSYGSNDATTQQLPTLYGVALAENTNRFLIRLRNTYAAGDGNIYIDWQVNSSLSGLDGSSYGKVLLIGLKRIA